MTDAWPEELLASSHRRWRTLSEAEWEAIRREYLAGAGARDLCARHEVGLSTLRLKARVGGWRRSDWSADSDLFPADADAWAAPDGDEEEGDAILEVDDWPDMIATTRRRLRRAIASGRAAEAASWMRLYDRLRASRPSEPPASPGPAEMPAQTPPPRTPDANLQGVIEVATRIDGIARRADRSAREGDEATLHALEDEVAALKEMARRLDAASPGAGTRVLDSLDSLDPVFSGDGFSP